MSDTITISLFVVLACFITGLTYLHGRRIDRFQKRIEDLEKKAS